MIGYVTLGTNDLMSASRFYDSLLGEIGAERIRESDTHVIWASGPDRPALSVFRPHDGKLATVGNGVMVGLMCDNPAAVDQLYKKRYPHPHSKQQQQQDSTLAD